MFSRLLCCQITLCGIQSLVKVPVSQPITVEGHGIVLELGKELLTSEHREYTVSGGVGEAPKQNHSALMMRKGENGTRRLPEMSSMSTYR